MNKQKTLRLTAEQIKIPLPLPIIKGNKDYNDYKDLLERLDALLIDSGIEHEFQEKALEKAQTQLAEKKKRLTDSDRMRIQLWTSRALRCQIARVLSMESFRDFSFHVGESHLLQKFCRVLDFDQVWVPSKSTLQEYSEAYDEKEIKALMILLIQKAGYSAQTLGLAHNMDVSTVLMDSTCVSLNIHFPVDWVLLRDGVRTLTKAIECIRRHGLSHRMKSPEGFRKEMNRYAMAMTQAKKGENARKERKRIVRLMKKLCRCVMSHGRRYRDLLQNEWRETDLSEKQAHQIINRIDSVLEQLPQAMKQSHDRIIGERKVENKDKILSLYEPHTQVYHRGKAGDETEFGLQLLVGESEDGLIMDYELVNGSPKNDTQHVSPCLERLKAANIKVANVVGDRGFASASNSNILKGQEMRDYLCPRNVISLKEKLSDETFLRLQKRRGQTEGRIGILKHNFIGSTMLVKGYERQQKHMAWSILVHNLWLIARRLIKESALQKAA